YALRGGRSKLIASDAGDPFAALAQEWVRYDNAVFRDLPHRLQGGPLGDYLGPTATIVARSSRILEPFIAAFIRELVTRRRPRRLLDVGCDPVPTSFTRASPTATSPVPVSISSRRSSPRRVRT